MLIRRRTDNKYKLFDSHLASADADSFKIKIIILLIADYHTVVMLRTILDWENREHEDYRLTMIYVEAVHVWGCLLPVHLLMFTRNRVNDRPQGLQTNAVTTDRR